jgi:hypothetical protein
MQTTTALLDQYSVDPESVTVTEEGGAVNVTDYETGKVLIRTIGEQSKFDLGFAVDGIAANSCESTPFIPNKQGLMLATDDDPIPYFTNIQKELNYFPGDSYVHYLLIDRAKQCWGVVFNGRDLIYRDDQGVAQRINLIKMTREEVGAFQVTR